MSELPPPAAELPEADRVIDTLSHEGRLLHLTLNDVFKSHEAYTAELDAIAPVQGYYVPTRAPQTGAAPEAIREQWVGVHLPVRSKSTVNKLGVTGLAVTVREGLHALEQERSEANAWWQDYFKDRAERLYLNTFPRSPHHSINFGYFVFEARDGMLIPRRRFTGALTAYSELLGQSAGQAAPAEGEKSTDENHQHQAAGQAG